MVHEAVNIEHDSDVIYLVKQLLHTHLNFVYFLPHIKDEETLSCKLVDGQYNTTLVPFTYLSLLRNEIELKKTS